MFGLLDGFFGNLLIIFCKVFVFLSIFIVGVFGFVNMLLKKYLLYLGLFLKVKIGIFMENCVFLFFVFFFVFIFIYLLLIIMVLK